jgi:hypothetical protein
MTLMAGCRPGASSEFIAMIAASIAGWPSHARAAASDRPGVDGGWPTPSLNGSIPSTPGLQSDGGSPRSRSRCAAGSPPTPNPPQASAASS